MFTNPRNVFPCFILLCSLFHHWFIGSLFILNQLIIRFYSLLLELCNHLKIAYVDGEVASKCYQ